MLNPITLGQDLANAVAPTADPIMKAQIIESWTKIATIICTHIQLNGTIIYTPPPLVAPGAVNLISLPTGGPVTGVVTIPPASLVML